MQVALTLDRKPMVVEWIFNWKLIFEKVSVDIGGTAVATWTVQKR